MLWLKSYKMFFINMQIWQLLSLVLWHYILLTYCIIQLALIEISDLNFSILYYIITIIDASPRYIFNVKINEV